MSPRRVSHGSSRGLCGLPSPRLRRVSLPRHLYTGRVIGDAIHLPPQSAGAPNGIRVPPTAHYLSTPPPPAPHRHRPAPPPPAPHRHRRPRTATAPYRHGPAPPPPPLPPRTATALNRTATARPAPHSHRPIPPPPPPPPLSPPLTGLMLTGRGFTPRGGDAGSSEGWS